VPATEAQRCAGNLGNLRRYSGAGDIGGGDMKIREGAYYRARNGAIYGPMMYSVASSRYPVMVKGTIWCWGEDGFYQSNQQETEHDLISEAYVSDTPPADVPSPETKTLRDEFASDWMKGVLANPNHADGDMESFACMAYRMADAMMEARQCWKERKK
jgi:hypothetical protein